MAEGKDYGQMSDEEFLNTVDLDSDEETGDEPAPSDEATTPPTDSEDADEATDTEDEGEEDESDDDSDDSGDTAEEESEEGEDDDSETEDGDEAESEDEDNSSDTSTENQDSKDTESKSDADSDSKDEGPDFEAFYKDLTKPFKANGKDFQVDNAADAIQLMQMGVNYNKKMAALKPSLKSLRLLEDHGLLSEEKLNYLIDLDRKDPKAIAKLLADSKLDPMDIDVESGSEYQAPARQVDETAMVLDEVLGGLKESPNYVQLLDTVSNKWDSKSKETIASNPELLNVINQHMDNGIYGVISEKIERERTLGRLKGLSDLEAYKQMGDALDAQGGFDHLFQSQPATEKKQGQQVPEKKVIPKADKQTETARRAKRKAASGTKTSVNSGKSDDFNPLKMSDDDFMKQFNPELL